MLRLVRVGFDCSPLHRPHPRGLVRVVSEALAALERRDRLEVVRLAPPDGAKLGRWRTKRLRASRSTAWSCAAISRDSRAKRLREVFR